MLCEQAERLIPRFAGDDLPAREADTLQHHLEFCANCRQLASEFEESRDWLINLAAPRFDEAMLDGVRDSVLKEIGQEKNRPGLLGWILPRWNPRFAFAASLALLLLIAAFGLLANRRQPPQTPKHDQAEAPKDAGNQAGSQPGGKRDEHWHGTGSGSDLALREVSALKRPGRYRSLYRTSADSKSPQPEAQTVEPDVVAENIELPDPAKTDPAKTDLAKTDLAKTDLAANREMTRIEFQTADPNIRIIWLTPKDSSLTKPNTNVR